MKILSGKEFAENIVERLKEEASFLSESPGMAAILIGNSKASKMYVELKEKVATEIGIQFLPYEFPEKVSQKDIIALIETLNKDEGVQGILVQLPLPKSFDKEKILSAIDPRKDVDGLHAENQKLFLERHARYWCPFPRAIMTLLESTGEDFHGKQAALLVNSSGLGKTLEKSLAEKGVQTHTVSAGELENKRAIIASSDIVISALGIPECITEDYVKPGAILIDGGIERVGDTVKGDMHPSVRDKAGYLTPVPGGVGPLTIAHLMENVVFSSERKNNIMQDSIK